MPIQVPVVTSLEQLEAMVAKDLETLYYPQKQWMKPVVGPDGKDAYDVVIVGGGHCGIAAAFAVMQEKIANIIVLDENEESEEGPWLTYARMPDLRTRRTVIGMELGYPNLTFRAYYEARDGVDAYDRMLRITCEDWVAYLMWMRKVLKIPVQNGSRLRRLEPVDALFRLTVERGGTEHVLYARRVVLATGPLAMGGANIPPEVAALPKTHCAHAYERFDVEALKGKRIAILGAGATAFDNAGEFLDRGAGRVDVLIRKPKIYRLSVIRWTDWAGFLHTFADLGDKERWDMMRMVQRNAAPPTIRAIRRVEAYTNFGIHFNSPIVRASIDGNEVVLETPAGERRVDFLVLATGFSVNLRQCAFLNPFVDEIALWEDRFPSSREGGPEKYRKSPYLGRNYEFTEKVPGQAPYLQHIYNFNQTAQLSMGPTGRVSGLKYGVRRLLDGISRSFLKEDYARHLASVTAYNESEFEEHPWIQSADESLYRPPSDKEFR